MLHDVLKGAGVFLLDIVYPRHCSGCGALGVWLCDKCDGGLDLFGADCCPGCGIPWAFGICRCEELPDAIERVRSVGPYAGWLSGAVAQVKYHGEWARLDYLAPLLTRAIADLLPADALVPVPLHASRRKQRGFNQTEKIAVRLSEEIAVPVELALLRSRRTTPQVRLDGEGRQQNVLGAFAISPGHLVAGKRLILVDDVITTGATLGECAQVLRAAGAASVDVVTIAREL